jgi:DNA-binding NarL/FixJ family response regulator
VNPVRVLVVDDQALFRRVMSAVVDETEGFLLVGSAASGEESIVTARRVRPDLILMDVNLPGIDGVEATRRLHADSMAAAVVLLSTYDEDDWDGQTQECGAVAYMAKSALGPDTLTAVWAVTGG